MPNPPLELRGPYGAGISLANAFWDQIYGTAGVDYGALTNNYVSAASGMVFGGNPPYTISDFLAVYPKFFGVPTAFTGDTIAPIKMRVAITRGSNVITVNDATGIEEGYTVSVPPGIFPYGTTTVESISGNNITVMDDALVSTAVRAVFANPATAFLIANVPSTAGVGIGMLVTGPGLWGSATVVSFTANSITLSTPVQATQTGASFKFYPAPWVPVVVAQIFINMALASLMIGRYKEQWPVAMAFYIAHYLTLFMRSESGPQGSAMQIVQAGLQIGMLTSKSVGDVSAGLSLLAGFLQNWGAWNLTLYGVQFATIAAAVGSGPIYIGSAPGNGRLYW